MPQCEYHYRQVEFRCSSQEVTNIGGRMLCDDHAKVIALEREKMNKESRATRRASTSQMYAPSGAR